MNRIKELRKKNHLTLKDMGSKLSMLDSTLSQYENEKRTPNEATWQALANFFNVSVDYLKGYGYSKDYIYKQLDDAYKKDYPLTFELEPPFTSPFISARDEIEDYCKTKKINIPEDVGLEFWQKYFSFIFKDKSVKRLLTTKDNYSDGDIKELIIEAISWYGTDPRTKAIVNHIKQNHAD